jgi:capsular polysaccharide biosynthesis protein
VVRLPPRLRPLFPYLKPVYVQATAVVAPATRQLSRGRGRWLPTGSVDTLEQAARSSGGQCVTARPAETVYRPALRGRPANLPLTDGRDGGAIGRVAVAELPGGRVLGPHRAVLTGRGELVQEVSRYFGTTRPSQHPLFWNPFPPPPLEVDGRVGVLAIRADANYYHFLMDGLTRLGVLAQAPAIAPPEHWYVPQRLPFQRELLDLLAIAPESRIDADAHPHLRAATLVVPGPPAMIEQNPPWAVRFLRERLLPAAGPVAAGHPIYVTRGRSAHNRSVRNEAEVLTVLGERGFVAVDPAGLPVLEQIRAFASAPLIVAPHGAALTNLVFAAPGAAAIELFPAGCLLPDFGRLAAGVPGLRYRYLSAVGGPRRPTRAGAIVRDIDVDVAALTALLDELAQG